MFREHAFAEDSKIIYSFRVRFSIVIPTCNRSEKLKNCLSALSDQDYNKNQYEIVVIDDGSTDDTRNLLKELGKKLRVELRFFSQSNRGQGVARNRGIEEARGEIILFLGDDIIATPQLLQEHDRAHLKHPEEAAAVLGFITWHPKLAVTPLMKFMERGGVILGRFGGHQFAYDLLEGKETADWRFFYTSNISLKKSILMRFKFDPWFSGYGWEDIELGFRLHEKAGLALYYAADAIAYHDHMMTFGQFANRMRDVGFSSHIFHKKHPGLNRLPSQRKLKIFELLSKPATLQMLKFFNQNLYFYALSKKYFLEGFKKGYNSP